jgi:hypothetical protein
MNRIHRFPNISLCIGEEFLFPLNGVAACAVPIVQVSFGIRSAAVTFTDVNSHELARFPETADLLWVFDEGRSNFLAVLVRSRASILTAFLDYASKGFIIQGLGLAPRTILTVRPLFTQRPRFGLLSAVSDSFRYT